MQHIEHFREYAGPIRPLLGEMTNGFEQCPGVALEQRLQYAIDLTVIKRAEHRPHIGGQHLALTEGDRLVGQAHGIAHRTVRGATKQPQRIFLERNVLDAKHMGQVLNDSLRRHVFQRELQAARQDGHWQLLRIGGREQELDVGRRLFEGLEQRIERVRREHVYFVDQVDLVASAARRVLHVVQQFARVLDLGAACGVHLDQIDEAPLVDLPADRTLPAGCGTDARLAVQALGDDPRDRRLADAAGTGEQIGMVQALIVQRVDQGLEHMRLADHFAERARTPFTCKNLITHNTIAGN